MADNKALDVTENPMVALQMARGGTAAGAAGAAADVADWGASERAMSADAPQGVRMCGRVVTRRQILLYGLSGGLLVLAAAAAFAVFMVMYQPAQLNKLLIPKNLNVQYTAWAREKPENKAAGSLYIPDAAVFNAAAAAAHVDMYATSTVQGNVVDDAFAAAAAGGASSFAGSFGASSSSDGSGSQAMAPPARKAAAAANETVVMYVGNTGYFVSYDLSRPDKPAALSGCVQQSDLPPLEFIPDSLTGASLVDRADVDPSMLSTACPVDQPIWMVQYEGRSYLICQVDKSGNYRVMGREFEAAVAVNVAGVAPQPPQPPAGVSCPVFTNARRLRPAQDSTDPIERDSWWSVSAAAQVNARRRLGSSKRCVFMHGMGPKTDEAPTTTYTSYWGDVHSYAQCSSFVFLHRNTIGTAWDDANLQRYFCSQAANSAGSIVDTIVFSHSMGSLIVAGALQSGFCRMSTGARWYHIEGPMLGSKAADLAANICSKQPLVVYDLAVYLGFCSGSNTAVAVNALRPAYSNRQSFSQLVTVMRNNLAGAMCGNSLMGIDLVKGAAMSALATFVGYGESADGLVAWSSCLSGVSGSFDTTYTKPFYAASVHHLDGTCRSGDGWWGNDRQPCQYYKQMTAM